ncbi:MAG: hypothetical protein PHU50_07850, partial [Kiritimatiellae bacterium]|nr:hypothetical protein [Kiritimatiellia bacterium]
DTQPIRLDLPAEEEKTPEVPAGAAAAAAEPPAEAAEASAVKAPAVRMESLSAPVAPTRPARAPEPAVRPAGKKKLPPMRVTPPGVRVAGGSAPGAAAAPVRNAARVSLRERAAGAGRAAAKGLSRVPWQAWRTLAGIAVLAVAWALIARACDRSPEEKPAVPAAARPLTQPWVPAPEPYLD